MKLKPFGAALLLIAGARLLSAAQTHIHDLLPANTDGSLATGAVVLSWPSFTGTDGVLNTTGQRAIAINAGIIDLTIAANPAGVNYTAVFNLAGQKSIAQVWHVLDSSSAIALSRVIVPRPSNPVPITGSYKVDPSGIAPGNGLPGQVMTLNTLMQWAPMVAPVSTGPVGPQGTAGPVGPQGPLGTLGPQGLPGVAGAAGTAGIRGVPGALGMTGPQGPAGPAGTAGIAGVTGPQGPAGPNNNLGGTAVSPTTPTDGQLVTYNATAGQYQPATYYAEDSRKLQVIAIQPADNDTYNMPVGGSVQIFSATGAGNVGMIQLALAGNGGSAADRNDVIINATITICTNGEAAPCQHSDVGTFFLAHGGPTPPFSYSDNMTLTEYQDGSLMGGFRRIFIPFTNGCTITVTNKSNVANGRIFTQVYFYKGTPPPQLSGSRKKTFHMATIPFTSIAQYAPVDLINIAGRGQIEGIHFAAYVVGSGPPTWLEGDMGWNIDGTAPGNVGGTEDFFGGQYYWNQLQFGTNSWGLIKNGSFAGGAGYATTMYRIFERDPMVFDQSIRLTWNNGSAGQGTPPGPVNLSAIVFYYLDR